MLKLYPVALTDKGRKRNNNQDYLGDFIFKSGRQYGEAALGERGHLFAVADGMGGYAGGEVASELAITTLFEQYYNGPSSGDIGNDLSEAIRKANLNVHDTAISSGRNQMGTTLTLVLVKGNKAIFGNVGDSRTYLVRQGIPERVTHDHSLVQDQIDAGVLTPEQAERSTIRNFITRAIGHREDVESDLFEREIKVDDILLLCSDGLHGLLKEEEMGLIAAGTPSLEEAAQQMIDLANERGGPDNISVMLIRVEEVGEALGPILNGREARYEPPALLSQQTEPMSNLNRTIAGPVAVAVNPNASTVPNIGLPGRKAATTENIQPTVPMRPVAESKRPKTSSLGLILGGLFLLLLALAALAFVLFFNNSATSTNSPTPAPAPAMTLTPTATAAPTSPIPTSLATVTVPSNSPTLLPGTVGAVSSAIANALPAGGVTTSTPGPIFNVRPPSTPTPGR